MKNIRVSKNIRTMIEEFAEEGESVNTTLTRLLEDVEKINFNEKSTTINVSEENLQKLKDAKSYPTEPYSSIIARLISEKGKNS